MSGAEDLELGGGARVQAAFLQRAEHYLDVDRFEQAADVALEGLAHEPENVHLHLALARARLGDERWDDAKEAAGHALAIDPRFAPAHGLIALAELGKKRFHSAEEAALEALRLDPEEAFLYVIYGQLMRATGHIEKAERLFLKALEIDPEFEHAHAQLALLKSEANQSDAALAHGALGLRIAPEGEGVNIAMAVSLLRSGRPFAARQMFRDAVRMDPANDDLVEALEEADRCCRVIYLPMYYYSLLIERLPGKQFFLWGSFLALAYGLRALGYPSVVFPIAVAYIALCVYTWVAGGLVAAWIRAFPMK